MQTNEYRFFNNISHKPVTHRLAISVLALALSSCSTISTDQNVVTESDVMSEKQMIPIQVNTPEKTHIKESKVAFYEARKPEGSSGGLASVVRGTLEVRQHCLVVITESGTVAQPIFPSYTIVWNEAANTLNHRGKQYRSGDHIELGGGFIPSATLYLSSNPHIPDCPHSVLFLANG